MKCTLLISIVILLFSGCKKEQKRELGPKSGHLTLYRTHQTIFVPGRVEQLYEYAVAEFRQDLSPTSYTTIDAGSVKYGDIVLHNNNLSYTSNLTNSPVAAFTPLLDGGKTWQVTGKEGSVPALTATALPFPSFLSKRIDTLMLIHANRPLTLDWDNSVPCDSLAITIRSHSFNLALSYVMAGNISSFTFPVSELGGYFGFGSETSYTINLSGFNIKRVVVDGLPYEVKTWAIRNFQVRLVC